MSNTVIGAAVGALGIAAFVWLLVLNTRPLPDRAPLHPVELPPVRPGRDDQWADFRETVPNIRKAALAEQAAAQAVDFAFHPASLDAPDPAEPFCWFPDRSTQP